MSNIKITFHFHDVRAWPLNGGRAPSKLFNDHHTSLQSLLHSKTLVHSQNFRLQQPISLYGTHTNNWPCRFFRVARRCVCSSSEQQDFFWWKMLRTLSHKQFCCHCCDSLSTTFQPATISQQNNKISTTIQHRSQQSNTAITIQTQYSALFFKGTILHRLGLYFTLLAFSPEGFKPELITSPCHLFDSGEIFLGLDSVSWGSNSGYQGI